jgi:hypothetical protein
VAFAGDKDYDPSTLVYPAFLHTMGIRKATKTHLAIYTKSKIRVHDPQGIAVARLRSWDKPNDPKDDDEVTGYGVNSGENMIIFNTSMSSLGFYGLNEKGDRALNRPLGLTANELGDVYVADTGNHRVVRFRNPARSLTFIKAMGGYGATPGSFNAPQGVAMDNRGRVYVADTGNHRVQVLRADDVLDFWFGKRGVNAGELWHPSGIAVTDQDQRWSYYRDEFIAVIDLDHTRIQKFTLDGKFQKAIRLSEIGFATGHLAYLATDYYSNIWVTDSANHCIHKFDRDLNYLTTFGRKGTGDKEFFEPRGIAIYKRFGQVFVAEKESAQYFWVGVDVFDFETSWRPKLNIIQIDFFLTEPAYVTLSVRKPGTEAPVAAFEKKQYFSGAQKIYLDANLANGSMSEWESQWDSANGAESKFPKGKYLIKLRVEPTYSSYKYFSKELDSQISITD